MSSYFTKRNCVVIGICCFVTFAVAVAAERTTGYEEGLKHYENNEPAKAIELFKNSLATVLPESASGKTTKDEKALLLQLDDEKNAAFANYQLGLIYEAQGKLDEAATKYRNALVVANNGDARYVGSKKCKMCHSKSHKSWSKTKMAKTLDALKPGERVEAKIRLKFDPQKDYTQDPKCLECHTTGFGLPGGYPMPGDTKSAGRAKVNAGVTCEGCHGPASNYIKFHKTIMTKKQPYTTDQLRQLGQPAADVKTCTPCHNRRNPTVGPDFIFDYKKSKGKDTHENLPLKYRTQ